MTSNKLPTPQGAGRIEGFLQKLAAMPVVKPAAGRRGRLIFALDATASRQPTWDRACHIQAEMFRETDALGGLVVQLVYYRGFGAFEAVPWLDKSEALVGAMSGVSCLGGFTQIAKVLRHAMDETRREKVNALVFVGDCVEEDVDELGHLAGQLGILGVPAFMFHEGQDPLAAMAFQNIARLTGGAYCSFDASSAQQLRELLSAVAVYAAGGRPALEDFSRRAGGATLLISRQMAKR